MSAFGRINWAVAAAGLACLVAGSALAQLATEQREATQSRDNISQRAITNQDDQAAQPGQIRTTQRTRLGERNVQLQAGGQNEKVEEFLAACLLQKNKCEVEFGQLAQQRAQNPQVKEFAQQMVQDHQQLAQKLQPLADKLAGQTQARTERQYQSTSATGQNDAQRQPGDTTRLPGSPGATPTTRSQTLTATGGSPEGGVIAQLAQIEKQIGERQKQAFLHELQQKSGKEFDKCYVGAQVAAHMHMLAALEVISQQQGELAQVAKEAQPTIQQHLDHAKQLTKQLESGSQSGSQAERQTQPGTQRQ